ncbi:four-helix bundle copper-binding protein [Blastococcus sp. TF02A-26]|uniref:four-helix bundle copper-binding protein n=1 Tax=Blastococcus sp. TF02A-26 TaxID=2250577 RepID=UPI000DE829CD|nr:four-helix bundle copper-binding protein [Blastococcus sp. TF02A-26]RBY83275.1 four-helix bundle copper-binding protein [Blastococcus sp. TF02A-26]
MTVTAQMLATHPHAQSGPDADLLAACIDACLQCAEACTACADACLAEEMVADLRHCIRTDLDCSDVCAATARVLTRRAGHDSTVARAVLEACATACRSCGDECAQHAEMHEHCRVCAEACRRCEQACRDLLAALG